MPSEIWKNKQKQLFNEQKIKLQDIGTIIEAKVYSLYISKQV